MKSLLMMPSLPLTLQKLLSAHELSCKEQFQQLLSWLMVIIAFGCSAIYIDTEVLELDQLPLRFMYITMIVFSLLLVIFGLKWRKYLTSKKYLIVYQEFSTKLATAANDYSISRIKQSMAEAGSVAIANHLVAQLFELYRPELNARIMNLHQDALTKALDYEFALAKASIRKGINEMASNVPLIKANFHIETSLDFLTRRRDELEAQWKMVFESLSWWYKMKHSSGPDFSQINMAINELSTLKEKMFVKHDNDFKIIDNHFGKLKQTASKRIATAKIKAERYIQTCHHHNNLDSHLLEKSLWLSALSVPVSVWSDVDGAGNVYDALRSVNNNFADMSDADIWWESLFLPAQSLAGLAALTKGAYFEQLVASDTAGQLHEHFNNPDTDIIIDGIAFQLKATDSEAYIYSVDASIPVIATSEVASTTSAIDSGYSNEELNTIVDDALGGSIVDLGDTSVDAILTGLGGLGLFATIYGINHAAVKYENGGDPVEAIFEGAGVAIEGTAKALVDAAQMGSNLLASRPSRFIGRTLLKGLKKLDKKIVEKMYEK